MNLPTRDDLKLLMKKQKGWCVSVFMPTHRKGEETRQDPIRFKNLLEEAEKGLLAGGLRTPEAKELLTPAVKLLQDGPFWRYQSDGLAVFLSSTMFRHYRLPFNFEELVVVTNRFHIKPLLPLLQGDARFYVLALSQNEVRLLQGTRYSISEVELDGLPGSLAEALSYDDTQKQLQFHTRTPGGRGERAAMFHGHGLTADDAQGNVLRYFREINRGLQELLKEERAPLVLAGVDYLFPIYREANTYAYLVEEGIRGNPEELSAEELHDQAWPIVQPIFLRAQEEAIAQYKQLASIKQTLNDFQKVIPAACHGRIEVLFVAVGTQQWGTFDPDTNLINLHQEADLNDEDLLDLAAIQTYSNGGTVYALKPEEMPEDALVAAIFRY